jgi:hypothetical protein
MTLRTSLKENPYPDLDPRGKEQYLKIGNGTVLKGCFLSGKLEPYHEMDIFLLKV